VSIVGGLRRIGVWGWVALAFPVLALVGSHNWWARAGFALLLAVNATGVTLLLRVKRGPGLPPEERRRLMSVRQRSSRHYVALAAVAVLLAVGYLPLAVHEGWGVGPLLGFYLGECVVLGGAGMWLERRIDESTLSSG
jgi:cobalamin synthase